MNYNTDLLTSVSACQTAISEKTSERKGLVAKKGVMEHSLSSNSNLVVSIPQALQTIDEGLQSLYSRYDSSPEGKEKRDLYIEIRMEEAKRMRLVNRGEAHGSISYIDKQVDMEVLNARIAILDDAIAQMTTRKTALESVAPAT